MKLLCLFILVHAALAQPGFGRSYLRNSRLCHQWSCLNEKLGLSDSLPLKDDFARVLASLLPEGEWQDKVTVVIETCYHNRTRRYTNTCPGQALLHCVVDQLNDNCPEASLRKDDACAPVNSLAGSALMFSQSRYTNLETNIKNEPRPLWYLRNYFNQKCCNLPPMFNTTLLSTCGFNATIAYFDRKPASNTRVQVPSPQTSSPSDGNKNENQLKIAKLNFDKPANQEPIDPMDCCDMSEFIQPSWRQECGFKTTWQDQDRLVIEREPSVTTEAPTTTTQRPLYQDLVVVPQSCDKETCVFNKLNIISATGDINFDSFTKLLDNLTNSSPDWSKAKARVVTTCLSKPLKEYDADCEINKLLACTFDVLTENCPHTKKNSCKHSKDDRPCQISSSKYRPRKRRDICLLPEIQNSSLLSILAECGIDSLSKTEMVPNTYLDKKKKNNWFIKSQCADLTPSTSCLLDKMGTLNKYGFIDYFKMKDKIRQVASEEWLRDVYLSAFNNVPLYKQHCNSPKKVLNVVDSVLMTCPISKRKQTTECSNLFLDIQNSPTFDGAMPQENLANILKHYHYVFFPTVHNMNLIHPKINEKVVKKPIYNYGLLASGNVPPVKLVDVKKPVVKKPLVLIPVFMRKPNPQLAYRPNNNNILRGSPSWHIPTPQNINSTNLPLSTTPISTTSQPEMDLNLAIDYIEKPRPQEYGNKTFW